MRPDAAHPGQPQAITGPLLEVGGLWLLIVLLGVLLINGVLDHWRQQELQWLERSQLELTLQEIKGRLEDDLSLGMDLHHNLHIQHLLEDRLQKDAQLYSLEVLGPDGRVLFSTDRGIIGEPLPAHALTAAQAAARHDTGQPAAWHAHIASTPVMGIAVRSPFGETAGHVSASYASRTSDYVAAQALTADVLGLLLATALGGIITLWLALRAQHKRLVRTSQGRLAQAHAALLSTRQRLDDASARLDAMEHAE